MEST
jgi:hypothetical protein